MPTVFQNHYESYSMYSEDRVATNLDAYIS
jgi:hypothetical protein